MALVEGLNLSETITAISTPVGVGGIGIVRLSGAQAHSIAKTIFSPNTGQAFEHRKLLLGTIRAPGGDAVIDEVFCVFMVAPHTYTREPMAEIHCHSGRVVLEKILSLLIENGARLATPGEFTLRAYLNGRIDLTQAESVIDIINARTGVSLAMAQRQLGGGLRDAVTPLLDTLNQLLTYMEADIDFAEDMGIGFENTWRDLWVKNNTHIKAEIARIMEGFATCEMIREGHEVAIIGTPNVGKSSILNRFLGKERAIVTEHPGTTRDFIEEGLLIQGLPFRIIDTAGLRTSEDPVERLGTQKALDRKEQADLILLVIDASRTLDAMEISLLETASPENTLVVLNKADLPAITTSSELARYVPEGTCVLELSAKTGKNWHHLTHHLTRLIQGQTPSIETQALIPVNQRHFRLLEKAQEALKRFHNGFQKNIEEAYLASDLWEAKNALEAITGTNSQTDILSEIFSNFCVGK